MARGHTAVPPFSSRILKPLVASSMAALTGLSPEQAFRVLTPLEILASLLALLVVLHRRRVSWQGQAALLLALGSPLALNLGHAPILVCSLLLLLASLMVLALDRGQLALALAVACLAALTKEYGVLLGFAWGVHAYSRGRRLSAFAGACVPLLTLGIAMHLSPAAVSSGSADWWELLKGTVFYEVQLLGSRYGAKIVYLWLWSALWPVLLLAAISLVSRLRQRTVPDTDGLTYAMMLVAAPALLSGDWDRSLLILVPFACIAASSHSLIGEPKFQALLAIGGVATALARPLYTVWPAPRYFTLSMIAVSIAATVGITAQIGRHHLRLMRGFLLQSGRSRKLALDVNEAANPFEEPERAFAVSLVVPVRDEASSIGALLESIRGQTFPPTEIVFVDGGSKDDTVWQLRLAAREDERIRVIEAGDATPGRGRNVGIAAARNEWIALTDAGTRPERMWLERLVDEVRRDSSVQIVYGHYEPVIVSFFERCAALAYVSPTQERPGGNMRGPSIASTLLLRSVWRAAGGFPDLRAAEDLIFMEAINKHGFKTAWAPRAMIWWHLQPSLGRTIRKFVVYSRHNVRAGRQRHWHYGLARLYLACVPFIALGLMHSLYWLALPALGALARVAKNIWDRRESRGLLWALNPFQFAGVGVVMTCIDFATFWGWVEALRRPRSGGRSAPAGERDLVAGGKG